MLVKRASRDIDADDLTAAGLSDGDGAIRRTNLDLSGEQLLAEEQVSTAACDQRPQPNVSIAGSTTPTISGCR
ncbi:MAG: hypothetical protein ACRDJ9_09750 [Dehalococcoidia bacterium]